MQPSVTLAAAFLVLSTALPVAVAADSTSPPTPGTGLTAADWRKEILTLDRERIAALERSKAILQMQLARIQGKVAGLSSVHTAIKDQQALNNTLNALKDQIAQVRMLLTLKPEEA